MSHTDHLLASYTALELAKLLAATAKENAELRNQVFHLEHELFWMRSVDRTKDLPTKEN